MSTFNVVVRDVGFDIASGFFDAVVFGHFEFLLDRSKARFHEGIVVTVIGSGHTLTHTSSLKNLSVLLGRVLTATISVMNQTRVWLPIGNGVAERLRYEFFCHVLIHVPAYNSARVQVH